MNDDNSKFLVAGDLLLVGEGVNTADVNDLIDTLLFAQLVADDKSNRFDTPDVWFSAYRNSLLATKWTGSVSDRTAFEPDARSSLTFNELIKDSFLSKLSKLQAREVSRMLDCVSTLPATDTSSQLLHKHAFRLSAGVKGKSTIALQVSVIEKAARLSSVFIVFTTTDVVAPDPLHQVFPGSGIVGEVEARFFQREWDRTGYQGVRKAVQQYLNGKREGNILPLTFNATKEG